MTRRAASGVQPRFAGIGGHHKPIGGSDVWLTPPEVLDALGGAGSFDLDPCAVCEPRPWPTARRHYTIADNGLLLPWHGRVWLNAPYSSLGLWLARMAEHNAGVALLFARTETEAFFRYVWERAAAVLFVRGRFNFHHPDGTRAPANSGAPSVLCGYGAADADALAFCGIEGQFVPLLIPRAFAAAAVAVTWREAVRSWFRARPGPARLSDLYRAFADHPKARANPNFAAKIRQVVQEAPEFRRVGRGEWELAL